MAAIWFSSFFENDRVLRTSRPARCLGQNGTCLGLKAAPYGLGRSRTCPRLGQNGTFRACPLSEGAVETLDVLGAFSLAVVSASEDDGLISPQKVGVTLGVQVTSGQAVP